MKLGELDQIKPVHSYDKDGKGYEYEYTYTEVHLDEVDLGKININGLEVEFVDPRVLKWDYTNKPTVYVTQDKVYSKENTRESRKQAYFALSVLESNGYVSGWGRV